MDENVKLEKEIDAILNYFKLILVEQVTKNKSLEAFKLLNGVDMFKKLEKDIVSGFIELDDTNYKLYQRLIEKMKESEKVKYSFSPLFVFAGKDEAENERKINWLSDVEMDVNCIHKSFIDTVRENCSEDVLYNVVDKSSCEAFALDVPTKYLIGL